MIRPQIRSYSRRLPSMHAIKFWHTWLFYSGIMVTAASLLNSPTCLNGNWAGIRFVIKNTSHDFLGKSSGASLPSVWMHGMKDMEYIPSCNSSSWSGPVIKTGEHRSLLGPSRRRRRHLRRGYICHNRGAPSDSGKHCNTVFLLSCGCFGERL